MDTQLGRTPNIAGAKLHIGSVDTIVVGVTSGDSMGFPGTPKAWLLGPDPQIASSNLEFVVGHLSRVGYLDDGRWALSVGGILLALLVLPFVSQPSIGECGSGSQKPPLARRGRFWTFLFAKITISSAIVFYASVDLGCLLRATLFAIVGLHTGYLFSCTLPFGSDMGLPRPEASMPYLSQTNGASSSGWAAIANLPWVERHRNDLRAWPHPTSNSRDSHQLVRRAALGLPRRLMAIPLCSTEQLAAR